MSALEAEEAAAKLLIASAVKDVRDVATDPDGGAGLNEDREASDARDKAASVSISRQAEVDLLTQALSGAHAKLSVLRCVKSGHFLPMSACRSACNHACRE